VSFAEAPPGSLVCVLSVQLGYGASQQSQMAESGSNRRVVVTGMGVVTPIGQTVADFWESLKAGKCGVAPIERFFQNEPHFLVPSQIENFDLQINIAAQIRAFDHRARLRNFKRDKLIMFADRYSLFAAVAADEAVKQAGLAVPFANPQRTASIIGSAEAGIVNLEIAYRHIFELKHPSSHPLTLVRFIGSSAAAHVGIEFGIKGPVFGACSSCASGAHAIGLGRDLIRNGIVDVAIVGGSESPHTYGTMREWEATGLLSPSGIYPFARRHDGTVLGEGAGILVLESMHHARERGVKILAELCGFATTTDSTDMFTPDVETASEAMRLALDDAQLAPGDIGYVHAHGTGVAHSDRVETWAIKRAFGSHATELSLSSTKSMYGHPLGASGGIGAVVCIKALQEGWVPPTVGLAETDPECDLDCTPNVGRRGKFAYAMCNAFGFTGLNAVLVFGPPPA
jgi:nodulation protein E